MVTSAAPDPRVDLFYAASQSHVKIGRSPTERLWREAASAGRPIALA
jgi:hypothetical protein